jgi:glutamine synthetase
MPQQPPADASTELSAFLTQHPDVRFVDVFLNDLNTIERGKRIDRAGIGKIFTAGMPLPGSLYAVDVLGGTIQSTGLGFDEGDADRPCRPLPGSLLPVPWLNEAVAQLQVSMYEHDGRPFFGDPRHVLARVLDRFHRLNLRPVVAIEYEFYLVDRERDAQGQPQPPRSPITGRREFRTQINSMTDLSDWSPLLAAIESTCRAQGITTTSSLAEYGPGQFEVNLPHHADALHACDEALRFKRAVRGVARTHGCEATFLAKPYREMAGSGLHVHVSLEDAGGRNIFASEAASGSTELRHAVAGLLDTLGDGMLICAPGPNSYRRLRPEAYVPMTASWSVNNRGSAIRIPASDADNRRIEHRLAGADANPYLVVAWVLAGIHRGLSRGAEPPPALSGNAYRQGETAGREPLPMHWATAIPRFAGSSLAAEYLGKPFTQLYSTVKQAELDDFNSYVTPLEIEWYMGAL